MNRDPTGSSDRADDYLRALLAGDRRVALDVALDSLGSGLPLLDLYADVIERAQHRIGAAWEAGEISIADEHVATAISQYVLSVLYERNDVEPSGRRALVTGVRGELHQLGPHMVADALETDGWTVRFLGSDVPDEDVVQAVVDFRPQLVGISATMPDNVDATAGLIRDLRWEGYGDRIIVGGAAFRGEQAPWQQAGADAACTDVRSAVQVAGAAS